MGEFDPFLMLAEIEERRAELRRDIRRVERLWCLMVLACALSVVTVVMAVML